MKTTKSFFFGFIAVLGLMLSVNAAEPSQADLAKQAKITKAQAEQIALAKVPHGKVKSVEIENEKGHLVWSFDIATPNTKDITEVLVDAKTGKIISTAVESPKDQAKEAAADKKK
ncbi:MAG: hypothetical protein DLM73_06395 [Chthoniobacterales bacterium]|nr:MAG: hypothetical protein DLM73_06395 [Chthoniobacterales bacterium]